MKRFSAKSGLKTRVYVAAFAVLLHTTGVFADEIKVLSSVGIKAVIDELAPQFEKATKHKVTTVFGLAGAHKTSIDGGAPFDVAILTPPLLDDLIAKGRVSSKSNVARTGLGLMIKAGAHKPDVSSVDAFKRTLLAAKSITFASAGASGIAFLATAKQLGIADAIKTKPAASGDEVNANVLSGASDLAVLPVSEILPVKGRARRCVSGGRADLRNHGRWRQRQGVRNRREGLRRIPDVAGQ